MRAVHPDGRSGGEDVHVAHLDRSGLLPDVEVADGLGAGLRLAETWAVDRRQPWRIKRFVVPGDYVSLLNRRRRLEGVSGGGSLRRISAGYVGGGSGVRFRSGPVQLSLALAHDCLTRFSCASLASHLRCR